MADFNEKKVHSLLAPSTTHPEHPKSFISFGFSVSVIITVDFVPSNVIVRFTTAIIVLESELFLIFFNRKVGASHFPVTDMIEISFLASKFAKNKKTENAETNNTFIMLVLIFKTNNFSILSKLFYCCLYHGHSSKHALLKK